MQVAREMEMNRCEILGLSEMRWGGFGRMKLTMGETMLFSDRVDNLHRGRWDIDVKECYQSTDLLETCK